MASGIVAAVAIFGSTFLGNRVAKPMKAASDAATAYAATIRTGDYTAAFDQQCAKLRTSSSPEQLAATAVKERNDIGEVTTFKVREAHVSGDVAVLGYRIETTVQGRIDGTARMAKEGDAWKWCGAQRAKAAGPTS